MGLIIPAIPAALCFSSSFWRQMEPYFGFISDVDIAFLKQQVIECLFLIRLRKMFFVYLLCIKLVTIFMPFKRT